MRYFKKTFSKSQGENTYMEEKHKQEVPFCMCSVLYTNSLYHNNVANSVFYALSFQCSSTFEEWGRTKGKFCISQQCPEASLLACLAQLPDSVHLFLHPLQDDSQQSAAGSTARTGSSNLFVIIFSTHKACLWKAAVINEYTEMNIYSCSLISINVTK